MSSTAKQLVPNSELPATPQERQQVLQENSSYQFTIAGLRLRLAAEARRCAQLVSDFTARSTAGSNEPSSGVEPGNSGE